MRKPMHCLVYIAILVLWVSVTVGGQSDVPKNVSQERLYWPSTDARSSDRAQDPGLLENEYVRVGTMLAGFLDNPSRQPGDRWFQPQSTHPQPVDQVTLDENVYRTYLGFKSKTRAARPVLARFYKDAPSRRPRRDTRILFLDDNGRVLAEKAHMSKVAVSRHAQYVAVFSRLADLTGEHPTAKTGRWQIFDRSGQKRGEVKVSVFYDVVPNRVVLCDAGNWAVIDEGKQLAVRFYGENGEVLREVTICEERSISLETEADFSGDGRYFLLHLLNPEQEASKDRAKNQVLLFSSDGSEIWRFIPDQQLDWLTARSIYRDGSYIVTSFAEGGKTVTYILDKGANVTGKVVGFRPSQIKFSSSGKYVVLFSPSEGMILLETGTGKILYDYRTTTVLDDVDLADNAELVGVLRSPLVVLLNFDGEEVWKTSLPGLRSARFRKISLSDDGNEISVVFGNEFRVYITLNRT